MRKLSLIILVLVGVVLAEPTKAQQVLKVGAPPNPNNGSPYSHLDPKSSTMQGVVIMLRDVNSGRLKAGFADYSSLAYALRQGLFPEVRLVRSYEATSIQPIAIGARQSDGELLSKIDAAIAKLNTEGTVQQIIATWGLD